MGRDETHTISRNLLFDVTSSATVQAQTISLEASTNMTLDADVMMMGTSPLIQFMADTTFQAISSGAAVIGGSSIAMASSSISMGAGADAPGGAPGAQPVLRLQPTFNSVLNPLIATVSAQTPVVAGFGGTPLAPSIPVFNAIIAYLVALHAELASAGSSSVQVT